MKTSILISCFVSVVLLAFAAVILKGQGDRFINNYRDLSDEQKARINVFRMRILTATLLAYVALIVPLAALATTDAQHGAIVIATTVVILAHIFALRFWAGVPWSKRRFKK